MRLLKVPPSSDASGRASRSWIAPPIFGPEDRSRPLAQGFNLGFPAPETVQVPKGRLKFIPTNGFHAVLPGYLDILTGYQDSSERQRRSETEPKVGAQRLPWVEGTNEMSTPTGLRPIAPFELMWAKPNDQ